MTLFILIIVIVLGYFVWNMIGRPIDVTIQGVNYQLGTENRNHVNPETVSIKGSWSRKWNGLRIFEGTITFAHDTIPVPEDSRKTTIYFDKNGWGPSYIPISRKQFQGLCFRGCITTVPCSPMLISVLLRFRGCGTTYLRMAPKSLGGTAVMA